MTCAMRVGGLRLMVCAVFAGLWPVRERAGFRRWRRVRGRFLTGAALSDGRGSDRDMLDVPGFRAQHATQTTISRVVIVASPTSKRGGRPQRVWGLGDSVAVFGAWCGAWRWVRRAAWLLWGGWLVYCGGPGFCMACQGRDVWVGERFLAIEQLTEHQVRTMTVQQKDRWWLENVYRGDMPQLTLRSALTGMLLGGVLSLTNLYVGMKTGWTLGVGITSVILAFALFKVFSSLGVSREYTILENNCMQSIATAAGYMTAPLIASLPAFMILGDQVIPMGTTIVWMIAIALLGVLFAFPLKRRFINDEQHAFPEGRAAGIVMDALHNSDAATGLFKAKVLALVGVGSAAFKFFVDGGQILARLKLEFLAVPNALEAWFFNLLHWHPRILGTRIDQLGLSLEPDHVLFGAGGLMGIRTGVSILVGAIINYGILAPAMIQYGDILGTVSSSGEISYSYGNITVWSLWCGVAVMTAASLLSFFSKPAVMVSAFKGVFGRRRSNEDDCLRHIELPLWVFVVGIPLVGAAVVYLAHHCFGVKIWHGIIAIPLVFVFTVIAAHATALTAITPTGPLSKLTQLTYAAIAPKNIGTNIITASINSEVAGNASNLMMDIKPGYMLGGKPRHQAVGHVLGILAGAFVCVPVYYALFLKDDPAGLIKPDYPMPAAVIWMAVAQILTRGFSALPTSALYAAIAGLIAGLIVEGIGCFTRRRLPVSAVGVGLAFVIPCQACLSIFFGAFFFWAAGKVLRNKGSLWYRVLVENAEPVCGGLIAGGALMGIAVKIVETFVLSPG